MVRIKTFREIKELHPNLWVTLLIRTKSVLICEVVDAEIEREREREREKGGGRDRQIDGVQIDRLTNRL